MIKSRIWIEKNGKNFIGHGKVELLEKIEQCGSINAAAKSMKMSYKAAWDTIDSINNQAKAPVIIKVGNGSRLSDEGKRLVVKFRELEKKQSEFLSLFDDDLECDILSFTNLSAKNQLVSTVRSITNDGVGIRLELRLNNDMPIFANITKESFEKLKINIGKSVFTIIKASLVKISKTKLNSINAIKCKIKNVKIGEEITQVSLLSNDLSLTSTMKNRDFKFKLNDEVFAFFDPENVIIGI